MVAWVAAGRGCSGCRLRPLPRQGGGLVPGDFLPGGAHLGGRGGGRPWLHSGGIPPLYLVPLWALSSGLTRRMGWALVSSNVSPSGLSGALPWSSWGWWCHCTRICTLPFWLLPLGEYWIVPSHQIQSPVWLLRKGCWTLVSCWKSGYVLGCGGATGGRQNDEDAWSEWAGGFGAAFAGFGVEVEAGEGVW